MNSGRGGTAHSVAEADPRVFPRIELPAALIISLLERQLGSVRVTSVHAVGEGLTNTIFRIRLGAESAALGLRLFAGGLGPFENERRHLAWLAGTLPVPVVLAADASCSLLPVPYLVYRWIDGVTLNAFRRAADSAAWLALARPLGRLMAALAAARVPPGGEPGAAAGAQRPGGGTGPRGRVGQRTARERTVRLLEEASVLLSNGTVRQRLGGATADRLADRLEAAAGAFGSLGEPNRLVHGDLGGRNVVVVAGSGGTMTISGLIDWEHASVGWPLSDIGSLFRYGARYPAEFRRRFEAGYEEGGGMLPPGWWGTARLLDSGRLLRILSGDGDLPGVFRECRGLIATLVEEDG